MFNTGKQQQLQQLFFHRLHYRDIFSSIGQCILLFASFFSLLNLLSGFVFHVDSIIGLSNFGYLIRHHIQRCNNVQMIKSIMLVLIVVFLIFNIFLRISSSVVCLSNIFGEVQVKATQVWHTQLVTLQLMWRKFLARGGICTPNPPGYAPEDNAWTFKTSKQNYLDYAYKQYPLIQTIFLRMFIVIQYPCK